MDSSILNITMGTSNEMVTAIILALACFRVWLELIGFDFSRLPMTKAIMQHDQGKMVRFHRFGLWMSIGTILFTAPGFFLA